MSAILDTFGRMHPMVLHVPIGVLVGLGAWEVWRGLRRRPARLDPAAVFIAWFGVLSSAAAVGTGLLHEREFDPDQTLVLHKWLGIASGVGAMLTAALASVLARVPAEFAPRSGRRRCTAYRTVLFLTLAVLIPAGHLGADLTHGEGYLFEPLLRASRGGSDPTGRDLASAPGSSASEGGDPSVLQARAFEVLASRCESCHGPARTRGGLRVTSLDELVRGGRDGPALVPGDAAASLLVVRMRLPIDHRDHMPPSNRPQPEEREIVAIEEWIRSLGAARSAGDRGPSATNEGGGPPAERVSPLVSEQPVAPRVAVPEPPTPDPSALTALRDRHLHVQPIAQGSNRLWIDLSGPTLGDAEVQSLLGPLRQQVAHLSLARSRVTDRVGPLLASMPGLERLDLAHTALTTDGLSAMAGHPTLRTLVIIGTTIGDDVGDTLASMPALERVYAWRSAFTTEGLDWLALAAPGVFVDMGESEGGVLEVEPPVVVGDGLRTPREAVPSESTPDVVPPVNTTCPVTGAPVDVRHVLVHEGRAIGFCCENCLARFKADPAPFLANLPPTP